MKPLKKYMMQQQTILSPLQTSARFWLFFCAADHFTACKFVCEILADCLMRGAEFDINFFKHLQRVWNVEGLLNSKVCLDCPKLSSFQRKLEQKLIGETVWKSLVNEQLL